MKEKFEWSKDYELGLPVVDDQHQSLVYVINRLIESASLEKGREIAAGIALDFLVRYVGEHFRDEEEMFLKTKYPRAQEHIQLHEALKKSVYAFKQQFDNDDFSKIDQFTDMAKNWLVNHILKIDREYVEYCKAANIGTSSDVA